MNLERVVLGSELVNKVLSDDGELLHDVVAHARHLCEEEQGCKAGDAPEECSARCAMVVLGGVCVCMWRVILCWEVKMEVTYNRVTFV